MILRLGIGSKSTHEIDLHFKGCNYSIYIYKQVQTTIQSIKQAHSIRVAKVNYSKVFSENLNFREDSSLILLDT